MEQKYKLKQVKQYLLEQSAVRFKGIVTPTEKNPVDFLKNFFVHNSSKETVFHEGTVLYEAAGRRRSIGDIYRIAAFYFPKLTLTTTYKTLIQMCAEGKIISSICLQTGKRVYRATKGTEAAYFNGVATDEYTTDLTKFEMYAKCPKSSGAWGYGYNETNLKFIEI